MPVGRVFVLLVVVTVGAWSAGYAAACAISPVVVAERPSAAPVAVATASPTPEPTKTPEPSPSATPTPTATVRTGGGGGGAGVTPTPVPTAAPPGLGVITITAVPPQGNRGTTFVLNFSGFPAAPGGTDALMTVTRPDQRNTNPITVHAGPDGKGTATFPTNFADPSGPYFLQIRNGGFSGQVIITVN